MRRFIFVVFLLVVILIVPVYQDMTTIPYDIVIYGGGFAGCAAAHSAAWATSQKKVLLIVPESGEELGGLGTVGGQNFADIRYWQKQLVTAGSFERWFQELGQFYNTKQMSETIKNELGNYPNITILYGYDIKKVSKKGKMIKNLNLVPVGRDEKGYITWLKGRERISGVVFIDASDDGRLTRFSNVSLSVGRQDWPSRYLPEEETNGKWARQQAATLMFKVKGIKKPKEAGQIGDLNFVQDVKGSWALVGGKETWQEDPVVNGFNKLYGSQGYAIKPINAAQDGAGSDQWWVNMLLVFNVDGRAHERDRNTKMFPEMRAGQKTVDQAWVDAKELLENPDFLRALRRFKVIDNNQMYGFGEVELVLDEKNKPKVGEIMYIRETAHVKSDEDIGEDIAAFDNEGKAKFALTTGEVKEAGANSLSGLDKENYLERVGLGYYMMDINAYMYEDIIQNGHYVWPVTGYLRPDWKETGGQQTNPVYLPYSMLKVDEVKNLLISGYAVSCSSFAWAEIRVLPNLSVLGDAAGVAAARAVLFNEQPAEFNGEQIQWVQGKLLEMGARLEKETLDD